MKKLLLIALVFVSCALQVQAADVNTVKATIVKHAIEIGVDPAIALSIASVESGFKHETKSRYGAVGVFQLLPSTAKRMGLNAYVLNDNIRGGIMYYKAMYNMFGSTELALAAYNAGPGNVKKFNNKVPPYAETKRFIARIMSDYNKFKTTSYTVVKEDSNKQQKSPANAPVPAVTNTNNDKSNIVEDKKPETETISM